MPRSLMDNELCLTIKRCGFKAGTITIFLFSFICPFGRLFVINFVHK